MKKYRLNELGDHRRGHILQDVMAIDFISKGGMTFPEPGFRSHSDEGPAGNDRHVHDYPEAFIVLQGRATLVMDEGDTSIETGDVVIVEPGENHHLVADADDPQVLIWLRGGSERNPAQLSREIK